MTLGRLSKCCAQQRRDGKRCPASLRAETQLHAPLRTAAQRNVGPPTGGPFLLSGNEAKR
jgi:hypothetical protein